MSELTLQLPEPLLDGAKRLAEQEKLTIEEYISRMLTEAVRTNEAWDVRVARGRTVTREQFNCILQKAPDVVPLPGDELNP